MALSAATLFGHLLSLSALCQDALRGRGRRTNLVICRRFKASLVTTLRDHLRQCAATPGQCSVPSAPCLHIKIRLSGCTFEPTLQVIGTGPRLPHRRPDQRNKSATRLCRMFVSLLHGTDACESCGKCIVMHGQAMATLDKPVPSQHSIASLLMTLRMLKLLEQPHQRSLDGRRQGSGWH